MKTGSCDMQSAEDAAILAIRKHLHCHFDALGIQDGLHTLVVQTTLLLIATELVQVLQMHTLHEVTAATIVGKHPYLRELVLLGHRFVQAHEVETVDRHKSLPWVLFQFVLLLIVELECAHEVRGGNSGDFDFDEVLLLLAFG